MKKITWQLIGIFALGLTSLLKVKAVLAQGFEGFDRSGRIKGELKLPDPEGGPRAVTLEVTQWILGFIGLMAVNMIIFSGYQWMTASGNEEKVTQAKKIMKYAIIGLIITLFSYILTSFIFSSVNEFAS